MGILLGAGLRARGLADITFVDRVDARLDFVEALGFAAVAAGSDKLAGWRHAADLAIDATGVSTVAAGLVNYAATGGTALFFGIIPADVTIEISPFEVFRRQLTLAGSHSLNHNIPAALDVIRSFDGDLTRLVSHRVSLEESGRVLATRPPRESLKIQSVTS